MTDCGGCDWQVYLLGSVPEGGLSQTGRGARGEETVKGETKDTIYAPHEVQTRRDLLLQLKREAAAHKQLKGVYETQYKHWHYNR